MFRRVTEDRNISRGPDKYFFVLLRLLSAYVILFESNIFPHEPEEEEHQAGAAEGEGVVLHRHHQAQAQPQQRAQVVGEAVQTSQQLPVPDQADLRGNYKCRNGEL